MFPIRFCFGYSSEKKDVALPNSIIMRIQQESIATASIRFIHNGLFVEVPSGMLIKNETDDEMVSTVAHADNRCFVLGWTCSYSITLNGREIVSLINTRDWDPDQFMTPPVERFWNISVPR